MRQKAFVFDGLWLCLCPSFNSKLLHRPSISIANRRRAHRLVQTPSVWTSRRCLSGTHRHTPESHSDRSATKPAESLPNHRIPLEPNELRRLPKDVDAPADSDDIVPERLPRPPPGVPKSLEGKPTSVLEMKLQELSANEPRILSATQILRILIRDRHVRPEVRHYRALILANSDPERGSPDAVRHLLAEMEENGIPADSGTLHAALQALAVHPDYLLRQNIVHTLRDRWLPLSPAGWHYVVAGLLREHQFELAIDHIAQMERKDIVVENWLYSLLIYYLCDFGEFDEVVRLMRARVAQGHDMSLSLWSYVLDVASASVHHEATHYVWRQMVELGYLHPSYEVCRNVLRVAAGTGDTTLGTSVIRFLVKNDVPLGLEDYEVLAETHVVAGDVYSGFEVLCKMHKAGIALEKSSTAALLKHMIYSKISPQTAWTYLKELKAARYEIPLRCAQVVIALYEHEALGNPAIVEDGVEFYKQLYGLCPEKADVSVYNSLIGMCRRAKNTDVGMFVVTEMAALGVVPDAATFEHLILMCLGANNSQSAYFYLQDMLARGCHPSEDARVQIRALCAGLDDEYAVRLKRHPEVREEAGCGDPQHTSGPPFSPGHSERRRLTKEERRAASKERRKEKRRRLAIQRTREEEGWEDYEPGGLIPEDQLS
ncbi:pentatricopeptide repeat protein [Aspergillus terreus]|uniref:Pentatricopeptide repeat protein n=1 Tax=Aspergillus terreus TaxID=33178 RepID=A0A5M3YL81_ASPTE|nr:hypothetical protein ATETN484_0001025800 [Aspergillus terreus]GFF12114.1 pentatricopeptide repeat protein [Aspergillus terreus]